VIVRVRAVKRGNNVFIKVSVVLVVFVSRLCVKNLRDSLCVSLSHKLPGRDNLAQMPPPNFYDMLLCNPL
jgi:hypothetical protein